MSRILDALRQSERDARNGKGEASFPTLPETAPVPPELSGEQMAAPPDAGKTAPKEKQTEASGRPKLATVPPRTGVSQVPPHPPTMKVAPDLPATPVPPPMMPPAMAQYGSSRLDIAKLKQAPVGAADPFKMVALKSERGLGAEKFRVLGARLSNIRLSADLNILQVTSSVVGEGKTLVAANLAMTLAKRFSQRVVLVEGDLRKPALAKIFGLRQQRGIGEFWQTKNSSIGDYLLRLGDTTLCLLPAGEVAHPATILQSKRLAALMQDLAQNFDWVIVDTPPLLPMADSNLWARVADGTLLVVRLGVVSRGALKKAMSSLDSPKLVGVVMNDASDSETASYYDKYYMARGDDAPAAPAQKDSGRS